MDFYRLSWITYKFIPLTLNIYKNNILINQYFLYIPRPHTAASWNRLSKTGRSPSQNTEIRVERPLSSEQQPKGFKL
jgi:hypothetical protein